MEIPLLLFEKIAQLFMFLLLGFISVKLGLVKSEDSSPLSKILLYVLTPAIVFEAFDVEMTPEITRGLIITLIVAVASHFMFLAVDFAYKKTLRPGNVERACAMYSNCGNLLIPIVISVLGKEWVIYSSGFLCVQLFFVWTHGVGLFSGKISFTPKKIFTNVVLISVMLGLIMAALKLRLPPFIKGVTEPLGNMVGPISMFICGMIATEVKPRRVFRDKRTYIVILMRMIVTPLIGLLLFRTALMFIGVPDAEKILLISYLAVIAPTGTSAVQFAQIYDKEPDFAVSINIIATLLCIVTMPIWVALYLM